ncbi:MAG: hypothetical protein NT069_16050, partial [Planctomycetota bacterium]|nr:hypothetical protein [Planctomycetota bacterium]
MSLANRRDFLSFTGAGLLTALSGGADWARLSLAAAAEPALTPEIVRFTPEIEPLVRKIEETPAEKCFEMAVAELKRGVTYRQFLAAVFLAGIRNVNPQPPGFKFHCVFAIHAAHQLSLDAPVRDRLLPLFWALAEFKQSQAEDVKLGDFVLRDPVGPIPAPEQAWTEFDTAMDAWDEPRADRAIVSLVRSRGAHEVIEGLWKYGARDYRNIGHKAIFVANAWRTLQTIGWRHAEPVLRSLVLALLDFKQKEVNNFAFENQSYLPNQRRVAESLSKLPGNWTATSGNADFTRDLLETLRSGDMQRSANQAVASLLAGNAQSGAVWDAVHLAAGELMMRQPGIFGIHTVTSVNALHYAFRQSAEPANRLLLLLQGIGWMCQFQQFMASRDAKLTAARITDLPAVDIAADGSTALATIFDKLSGDPAAAAPLALAFAARGGDLSAFAGMARGLVLRKQSDAHHYKYTASIFEDLDVVSPV